MACFVAPAGAAVVTTIVQKVVARREKRSEAASVASSASGTRGARVSAFARTAGASWATRLRWLNTMLWGGSLLLCLEHIWHGEVVPWPPFLTAMANPQDVGPMLREIAVYGSAMTATIFVAWALVVAASVLVSRRTRVQPGGTQTKHDRRRPVPDGSLAQVRTRCEENYRALEMRDCCDNG